MAMAKVPLEEARLFMRSRVLLTAAELDLITRLDERPATAEDLARQVGLDTRAATRLLDCLITFGVLSKDEGRYRPTEAGVPLSSRSPESVLPMLLHLNHLWNNWSHLTEAVQKGENPHRRPVTERKGEALDAFIGAMNVVGRGLSEEVAAACDMSGRRCLLDIGAGPGTYTAAFLKRNPGLRAVVFDLPEVTVMTGERLKRLGLADRVTLAPGDFYENDLPEGCDAALLSAIIHQNGPGQNLELFRKIWKALDPGGVLLIRDHVMDESRTRPPLGALFALNMLVCTSGGDTYTFREVEEALAEAGFERVRLFHAGERMECLVEAHRPR